MLLQFANGKWSLNVSSYLISDERQTLEKYAKSFGIKDVNDTINVQRCVYSTLVNENFFDKTNNRGGKYREDVNAESGMMIETNKSGIDETFNKQNFGISSIALKTLKLKTIRLIPKVIIEGNLIYDEIDNTHDGAPKYAYIYGTVDGITLKIAVRKSAQKNKFWVHSIEEASYGPSQVAKDAQPEPLAINTSSKNIVPKNGEKSTPDSQKMRPQEQSEVDELRSQLETERAERADYEKKTNAVIRDQKRLIEAYKSERAGGRAVVSFDSTKNVIRDLNARYGVRLSLSDDASELTFVFILLNKKI